VTPRTRRSRQLRSAFKRTVIWAFIAVFVASVVGVALISVAH